MGMTSAPRARRSSTEIRDLITVAARTEFALSGIGGATTRAIAKKAGVAEHLIFGNFGSKANLFEEAVIQPFTKDFSAFLQSLDTDEAGLDGRNQIVVYKLYRFLKNNASFLHALVKSSGEAEGGLAHALDEYFALSEKRLRLFHKDPRSGADVEPRLFVRYAFGMVASAVLLDAWFFPDGPVDDETAASALARIALKAMQPIDVSSDDYPPRRDK